MNLNILVYLLPSQPHDMTSDSLPNSVPAKAQDEWKLRDDEIFWDGFARLGRINKTWEEDTRSIQALIGHTVPLANIEPLIALLMAVGRRTDALNAKTQAIVEHNETLIRQNNEISGVCKELLEVTKRGAAAKEGDGAEAKVDKLVRFTDDMRMAMGAISGLCVSEGQVRRIIRVGRSTESLLYVPPSCPAMLYSTGPMEGGQCTTFRAGTQDRRARSPVDFVIFRRETPLASVPLVSSLLLDAPLKPSGMQP